MCGRYLVYANVPRICRASDVIPEECDDEFLSMSDVQQLCLAGMQLYNPEEYDIGIDLGRFTEKQS